MSNITYRSTSEELADPDGVSREHVLQRLSDWRDRVHHLYDQVERELEGTPFKSNREGKYISTEEFPQRVGVAQREQPEIDVLRIIRPDNTDAAVFCPRGLWVVGANGQIDLRIKPPLGGTRTYTLLDKSEPFARPARWIRMPIGLPFDREPFDPRWLISKLN